MQRWSVSRTSEAHFACTLLLFPLDVHTESLNIFLLFIMHYILIFFLSYMFPVSHVSEVYYVLIYSGVFLEIKGGKNTNPVSPACRIKWQRGVGKEGWKSSPPVISLSKSKNIRRGSRRTFLWYSVICSCKFRLWSFMYMSGLLLRNWESFSDVKISFLLNNCPVYTKDFSSLYGVLLSYLGWL